MADTRKDPAVDAMWKECEKYGIEADIGKRWEQGIPHHPKAEEMFGMIKDSDWAFGGDYFCWKEGGDGDNGETLKFALSVLLELEDARAKEKEEEEQDQKDEG